MKTFGVTDHLGRRERQTEKSTNALPTFFYGHLWMQNVVLEKILQVTRITFLFFNTVKETKILVQLLISPIN